MTEDTFSNFDDLRKHYREETDFRIRFENRGGRFLIFTPHGGGIEPGCSELVKALAGNDFSYYLFEGRLPNDENQKLHITSRRFDEPRCLELIRNFQKALVIHGCGSEEQMIFVGGKDQDLINILIAGLNAKDYPIQPGTDDYAGTYSTNICNRTSTGKGVQLEISRGLRRTLFKDWRTRKGRKTTTDSFARLIADIRDVLWIEG